MTLHYKWEKHVPWLLALLVGIVYFTTMSPSVGHTDAGELSAVADTFGVAHPTGYPLFTLLGWLFTRLPIGSVAFQLNLMCMLMVSASVWLWARFLQEFFIQMKTTVKKGDSTLANRIKISNFTATIVGTLTLAFGQTWWMQSTATEVYALHGLLLMVLLWTLLKAWFAKEHVFRKWAFFAVALALCFTNHLTSVILLPGAFWVFFARFGFKWDAWKKGFALAGIGLGVLVLFYGLLVVVAQSDPTYNWGNPENFPRLWHHMSGKQFAVWMFQKGAFGENLRAFFVRLPDEYGLRDWIATQVIGYVLLAAMAIGGMVYAFERRRHLAIFFGLGFFSNLFWASNYSIKDPEPYFLFCFIAIAFVGAMLLRWCWIEAKYVAPFLTAFFGLWIVVQVAFNYGPVNQKQVYQYEDYARYGLNSLPPNAILITRAWDVMVGPAYYLQGCEKFRTDVTIVDYAMLRNRHWYPNYLAGVDPQLAGALGDKLTEWEKAVTDFDLRGKPDPRVLAPRFEAIYLAILKQMDTRPVYFGPDFYEAIVGRDPEMVYPPADLLPVPERYFIRLTKQEDAKVYHPLAPNTDKIRFGGKQGEYEYELLKEQLRITLNLRILYERQFGHPTEAAALQKELDALGKKPAPKVEKRKKRR